MRHLFTPPSFGPCSFVARMQGKRTSLPSAATSPAEQQSPPETLWNPIPLAPKLPHSKSAESVDASCNSH